MEFFGDIKSTMKQYNFEIDTEPSVGEFDLHFTDFFVYRYQSIVPNAHFARRVKSYISPVAGDIFDYILLNKNRLLKKINYTKILIVKTIFSRTVQVKKYMAKGYSLNRQHRNG